jgi:hypothetical protein
MNRRNFLINIGLAGASIAVAPFVSFETPKRMIYKVKLPAFILYLKKKGTTHPIEFETIAKTVNTYRGTLKQFCERYPTNDVSIFFYEEQKFDNGEPCVRACAYKIKDNMEIYHSGTHYEPIYI